MSENMKSTIVNNILGQYGGFLVVKSKMANVTYPIILELLKDYDQVNTGAEKRIDGKNYGRGNPVHLYRMDLF